MFSQDFNNILTAVIGNPTVARRRTSDDCAGNVFDTAMRAARRVAKLVGDLLSLSSAPRPPTNRHR